jgi:hypothetical protein
MARRDQIIMVGGGVGQPLNIGASVNPNPTIGPDGLPIAMFPGSTGGIGGTGAGDIGIPNPNAGMFSSLGGGSTGSYLPNYVGTLAGGITPSTVSGMEGGLAKITSVITPPVTAVGTSFPLIINFINIGQMAAQFRVSMTLEQLGIDMVDTPPIYVMPGQPGMITQTLGIPTIAGPNVGAYIGTVQLIHGDQYGGSVVDDAKGFSIPSPSGIALQPGTSILPSGQVIPPGGFSGMLGGGITGDGRDHSHDNDDGGVMHRPCIQRELCLLGARWDPIQCRCVPAVPGTPGGPPTPVCGPGERFSPCMQRCQPAGILELPPTDPRCKHPTMMVYPITHDPIPQIGNQRSVTIPHNIPNVTMPKFPTTTPAYMTPKVTFPTTQPSFTVPMIKFPQYTSPSFGSRLARSYDASLNYNTIGNGLQEGETYRDHDRNLLKERDTERGIGQPPFGMPGGGIGMRDNNIGNCMDNDANAILITDVADSGDMMPAQGFNFCPGEPVMIRCHLVLHGHPEFEGEVVYQEHMTRSDHTGRFRMDLQMPTLPPGLIADGVLSAHGDMSHKHANTHCGIR